MAEGVFMITCLVGEPTVNICY